MFKTLNYFLFIYFSVLICFCRADGSIDVLPAGFMADNSTPYAIHFVVTTSSFIGYSNISAKIRMQTTITNANNQTWSHTIPAGWRGDNSSFITLQSFPISNMTSQGWLFGKSTSNTLFGTSTCSLRFRRDGSAINYDFTEPKTIMAWNPLTDAGWLEGTFPEGANLVVLAMDTLNQVLGSYITESNGINENYQNQTGYFKLAVPVGIVYKIELRDLNNQFVKSRIGPWSISANSITTIPRIASAPLHSNVLP